MLASNQLDVRSSSGPHFHASASAVYVYRDPQRRPHLSFISRFTQTCFGSKIKLIQDHSGQEAHSFEVIADSPDAQRPLPSDPQSSSQSSPPSSPLLEGVGLPAHSPASNEDLDGSLSGGYKGMTQGHSDSLHNKGLSMRPEVALQSSHSDGYLPGTRATSERCIHQRYNIQLRITPEA